MHNPIVLNHLLLFMDSEYGKNLAVQCIGCISFCVVSCYSTIKVLKNNCWNFPSPIYIVFGTALNPILNSEGE